MGQRLRLLPERGDEGRLRGEEGQAADERLRMAGGDLRSSSGHRIRTGLSSSQETKGQYPEKDHLPEELRGMFSPILKNVSSPGSGVSHPSGHLQDVRSLLSHNPAEDPRPRPPSAVRPTPQRLPG